MIESSNNRRGSSILLSIILRFEMDHLVSDAILQCFIPIAHPLAAISLGHLVFRRVITFRLERHH
jgi:hypothetical protein